MSNNTLATLATANPYEGETADLVWNKYIQVDGQWYVTSENTFKETATEAGSKNVVYKLADIAYFFEMENLTRTGGAYLTEESASYSGNARLRISRGSTHYTPALAEGVYTLTIGCANSNASASEVYVYTRSSDGTLSEKLYTHTATNGNTTLKCDIAVPEGYSIAFNGNEGNYNNNARMDYMILTPAKFEKSISAAGYATLYTDKALDFSETGLTAYVAVENGDEVSILTNVNCCVCNDFFAKAVDRRVCYLSKELFEIREETWMFFTHYGKRSINTHRSCWLNAVLCHRKNHLVYIFVVPAKSAVKVVPIVLA